MLFYPGILSTLVALVAGQLPSKPEGLTWLKSKFHENVTISFKEPGICETTPGVRSYSGYVHLPPGTLNDDDDDDDYSPKEETQNYPIHTFFWFFESRKDPVNAPLSIWLNGGPGASSLLGALSENGPCFIGGDSKSTVLNPWSWNNEVNMLYIDQPTQVGFSYDVLTNSTVTIAVDSQGLGLEMESRPADFSNGIPEANNTFHVGVLSSQNRTQTVNTTAHAAHALWHFAQTWFSEFPHYKPHDDKISIWAESYGGHYGPGIMRFFQQQNEKISDGTIGKEEHAHYLHLDTLGIVNGFMDNAIQGEHYITFANNNTYGIKAFDDSTYEALWHNWTRKGGVKEQILECEAALREPRHKNVTDMCRVTAGLLFPGSATYHYAKDTNHSWLDIAHPKHDPFPPGTLAGWLRDADVMVALGVPVNWTDSSATVMDNFESTYDVTRGGFLVAIAYLLDSGVKVHMMYGDRDYAASWTGGEAASLAVPYSRQSTFSSAGYAPLVGARGHGGFTRQVGNYSFSRVFQAGHMVPSYQPEVAYEIFQRAMFNRDIATGLMPVSDDMRTVGPESTWHFKNAVPETPEVRCYVLKPETCLPEVWKTVENGTAIVKDYYVVGGAEEEDREVEL